MPDRNCGAYPKMSFSAGFGEWLAGTRCSLVLSTYHSGKLITVGTAADGTVKLDSVGFGRCMGMAADRSGFWASTTHQLWRFDRLIEPNAENGASLKFIPQAALTTGLVNCHDVAIGPNKTPMFANTLFNCIATTDHRHSFVPIWRPDFISDIAPDDRCHLNGICAVDGELRLATGFAHSNEPEGWRDIEEDGWLIDIRNPDRSVGGLVQPHSPRLFGNEAWLLNSGAGALGRVVDGRFEPVFIHGGYPRGLSRIGDHLLVGLSKERRNGEFYNLPIGKCLEERGMSAGCGVDILDMSAGKVAHWIRFETIVTELFDVLVLQNCTDPTLLPPFSDIAQRAYAIGTSA
ncbi:TIGR03032 family protein [Hwanghaeella sp.]|uniref:TIGR03032 family protein n=1 Tax=Hwanghaeella sp. TaxID=2605943 RepID=UPI003CCC20B7